MGTAARKFIKRILPQRFLGLVRSFRNREYNELSPEQVFSKIYASGAWGKSSDPQRPFYSGSGSHREDEIATYVQAVGKFLGSLDTKPDVVDIGCGDFSVGSRVRRFCNKYTACDVVPALIDFNKVHFADLAVEFRTLDLVKDELPAGDIAFIRQVLQHLSNEQIGRFVARAPLTYKHLVVTEHLPSETGFKPNIDKPVGPGTRMGYESGVVLTSPPFNLRPKREKRLCKVDSVDTGILVTTLYTL